LHEACNFGAVEVVEALLVSGANINDAGGKFCDKITPMHDAASNGHIDVMSVILKRNPNVLAKNAHVSFEKELGTLLEQNIKNFLEHLNREILFWMN
jgi:ankyrin repeat protein